MLRQFKTDPEYLENDPDLCDLPEDNDQPAVFQIQDHQLHANICISCVGPRTNNGIHAFQPCSHVLFCKDCCEKFTFPVMCPYILSTGVHTLSNYYCANLLD